MKEKVKYNKKIELKNKVLILGLLFFVIIGFIVVPSIFASLQPVKSIEILSSKSSYSSKEGGSWRVTNSAEFISSNTALVTMDLDTISKGSSKYKDVVFLLDMSESMLDAKLSKLKSGVGASIENILKDDNNKVGLISFNSSSTLVSNLSNNKSNLINKVNELVVGNGTSYYQALINLDNILKNYENDENRELKVIFITDGIPSKDSPNEVGQYQYLNDKYSYLKIDAVQYEAGDKVFESLEKISDRQEIVSSSDLERKLINISTSATLYESFKIKEYLNNDYFLVESINDIKVDTGSVSLNNNVVTWNLDNIGSGRKAKMTFNAKLKTTNNGVYELNNNIEINSILGEIVEEKTSPNTPVLSNNYKVKYDGNKPSDCTISGVPDEATHKVFETVGIATAPKCSGYQFKGWDIVTDNVTKINDDYFVMPEEDVELKANWSKLDIRKSTDGVVEEGWTLYKQVRSDANSSNRYAKKYTGDTSTFTGNDDVYYYYGEAAYNNVIFANYCWKIVRTTDTGGVKLLYNGVPSNGTCNNTGDASVLTKEQMGIDSASNANYPYNEDFTSLAAAGYMNNIKYFSSTKNIKKVQDVSDTQILSQKVINNNGTYILESPINVSKSDWESNFSKYNNYYTCNNDTNECDASTIKYIINTTESKMTYVIGSNFYKYGNTFTYENGKYTLANTIENFPDNNHHYTCFNQTGVCDTINYIYLSKDYFLYFINLTNGKKVENAINEMLFNENVNAKDSSIKGKIDFWYANNMTEYTKYLEDTVWCNDRGISYMGGWNPNGNIYDILHFQGGLTNNLTCPNKLDRFTVNNTNGNSSLKYPVGLLTKQEADLANYENKSPLSKNKIFWSMTPNAMPVYSSVSGDNFWTHYDLCIYYITNKSYATWAGALYGVSPSISLRAGIEYKSGDGFSDHPYVIDAEI